MKINKINFYIIISILELVIGFCSLLFSIYGYFTSYSIKEAEEAFGGLVDFFYYKESMYKYFIFGILSLISGIFYFYNKKIHWFTTHSLIIFCFLSIEIPFLLSIINIEFAIVFFQIILLVLFIVLEIFQIKNLQKRNYLDKKRIIILSSIFGVLLFLFWLIII